MYWKLKSLLNRIKRFVFKSYYKIMWCLDIGDWNGTMIPKTGSNQFTEVWVKGKITQIKDKAHGEIRIIPYEPNCGVMIEYWDVEGVMQWRQLLAVNQLKKDIIYASNVQELVDYRFTECNWKWNDTEGQYIADCKYVYDTNNGFKVVEKWKHCPNCSRKIKLDHSDLKTNYVHSDPDCIFNYCPNPSICISGGCIHKR